MSAQSLRETRPAWSVNDTHSDVSCKHARPLPDAPISEQFTFLARECTSISIDTKALIAACVSNTFILLFLAKHLMEIHTEAKQLINGYLGKKHTETCADPEKSNVINNLAVLRQHKRALLAWAAHTRIEQNFLLKAPRQSGNSEELTVIRPRLFAA